MPRNQAGIARAAGVCALALCLCQAQAACAQEQTNPDNPGPRPYVHDHPVSAGWCPPIRSTFFEAERDFSMVGRRRVRHKPNGGYGLLVIDKVGDKHLVHLGADLGWYQVGEPVFAMADGVVRISHGPPKPKRGKSTRTKSKKDQPLLWGNYVVIEHRVAEDKYVTAVYGHLGSDRLVKAGDLVHAGQQIGTIGRNHRDVNGGFKPHIHLGIRSGRIIEPGITLAEFYAGSDLCTMKLSAFGESQIEVLIDGTETPVQKLVYNNQSFDLEYRDGKIFVSSDLPGKINSRPGFELVGYALSTDGWYDPIAFLKQRNAHVNPAPFRLHQSGRNQRRGRHSR